MAIEESDENVRVVDGILVFTDIDVIDYTVPTPDADTVAVYAKENAQGVTRLYIKDSAATESELAKRIAAVAAIANVDTGTVTTAQLGTAVNSILAALRTHGIVTP